MRSRVVAQQLNWAKRDDISQNTPLLVTARLLVSKASSFWIQDWARGAVPGSVGLQCRHLPRAA